MRFTQTCALVLAAAAIGAAPALAQTGGDEPPILVGEQNSGVGTTSAEFLLMGAGARGMAIGSAFSALTRDVEALYYNPAALPLMEGMEARATMMPYFADTNYLWAGFALPLRGGEYGFGLSIANFGFSDQPIYTESDQENESEQTYGVSETVIGLSFAHAFIDRFSGGVTLKLISDQLGDASAVGFAADIGTSYHAELGGRPIAMSFVIQNLGTGLKHSGSGLDLSAFPDSEDPSFPVQGVDPAPARFEANSNPLPVVFRVGVSYDVLSAATNRLSLVGEFNEIYNAGDPSFGLGGEFEWRPADIGITAALRGSYAYQPDNYLSDDDEAEIGEAAGAIDADGVGLDGMTLGGGLAYRFTGYEVRADYAYRHFGVLGGRNVFTVGFGWR